MLSSPEGRRRILLGVLLAALTWGWLSLARQSQLPRAPFVFCNQGEVGSLDPALGASAADLRILAALHEGLTRPNPAGGPALPGLASHWEVADDGLSWTFVLRKDARWSQGEPLDAHDVAFGLARVLHPDTAAPLAGLLGALRRSPDAPPEARGSPPDPARHGIAVLDPHRLRLQLARPCPELAEILALPVFAPVHRPSLARGVQAWQPEHWVGSGAFVLAARRLRDRLSLRRNPHYWDVEHVGLPAVDALAAEGATTQLNLFLTGESDWIVRPPALLAPQLRKRPEWVEGPQLGVTFLRLNTTRPPLDDPRVRTALAQGLDRRDLAATLFGKARWALERFLPAPLAQPGGARLPAHDPRAAEALLTQALGPRPWPQLRLLHPQSDGARDQCEALAESWRRHLGLELRIETQAWPVYLDTCRSLQYDLAWSSWIADTADASSFLEVFASSSGTNRTGWADREYDSRLEAARLEPVAELRAALWTQAEQRLLQELPLLPLFQRRNENLVSPRIGGFFDNPLDVHPLRDLFLREAP